MARPILAMLAVLLGMALTLPAQAQWKWRDRNGHTQYSDLPPPSAVPDQDILSRPAAARRRGNAGPVAAAAASAASGAAGVIAAVSAPAAAASSALTPKTVEPELEARRRKAEADQAAQVKAEEARVAAAKAENCNRARTQMRTLDSGIRVVRANEKGDREILDDKQRADEVRRTREVIASDCK